MSVWIQGLGVVGGFGAGRTALEEAMDHGRVEPGTLPVSTGSGIVEIPAFRADTESLERFVPRRALRRVDPFGRMALLGGCLALEDAGLDISERESLGLVLASPGGASGATLALLDSIFEAGDACASPTHFAHSLHNAPAAHLAILLGADGPSLTLSQGRISLAAALLTAKLWIEEGRARRMLVGLVEELSEVMAYAWFKTHGDTLPPGEGTAFFLLGDSPEGALAELAEVELGWGEAPGRGALEGAPELYGHGPAAPAFDVALALLRMRREDLAQAAVVALDPLGGYGLVRLTR